jgi:CRP-like cAMP-binding protein
VYDALIKYFNNYTTTALTGDEINLVQGVFTPKKFRKRQYILQEGEVCKFLAFIVKGSMRKYRVDDKGAEHVISLYIENWWTSDPESLMKEAASSYFIDAWEDSECLIATKADLTYLVDLIPP